MNSYSDKQREYYNKTARSYDQRLGVYSRGNKNHYEKFKRISNAFHSSNYRKVLEIGVGTGIHSSWFLQQTQQPLEYWGVDISEEMLKLAELKIKETKTTRKYNLERADVKKLPFKKHSFDFIFCSGTLHHIDKPQIAIGEMVRVLKPEGKLVIVEPNIHFPINFLAAVLNPMERNIFKMTKRNLRNWVGSKIFVNRVENFNYTPPFPRALFPLYNLIDGVCENLPVIRGFSIMIYLEATK